MNLYEIGLFHIFWDVSGGTRYNYREIMCGYPWKYPIGTHENNVLETIYIDIYPFRGYAGWVTWFTLHVLLIIHKNGKQYKSITYTKIEFYIILIQTFFS